jgi:membrane protein implicated in regulation of membrane protease activity
MAPSTGSAFWDTVLQIGLAAAMTVMLVLMARDYRNRR